MAPKCNPSSSPRANQSSSDLVPVLEEKNLTLWLVRDHLSLLWWRLTLQYRHPKRFSRGVIFLCFCATYLPEPLDKQDCLCNICHSPVLLSKEIWRGDDAIFSQSIVFAFNFVAGLPSLLTYTWGLLVFNLFTRCNFESLCILFSSLFLATKPINFILDGIILYLFLSGFTRGVIALFVLMIWEVPWLFATPWQGLKINGDLGMTGRVVSLIKKGFRYSSIDFLFTYLL